jgi:putative membrane protein
MFNGIHTGMGAGGWVLMVLLWVALLAAVVAVVARLFPTRTDARDDGGETSATPSDILDRRLARGEIDGRSYDALRAKLGPQPFAGRG